MAGKVRRGERIAAMLKLLVDRPGELLPLAYFSGLFGTAKSSVSEDLAIVRAGLRELGLGDIETVTGPAGGARYVAAWSPEAAVALAEDLAARLSLPERVLPGGFLYMTDLVSDPRLTFRLGECFASRFREAGAEYVLTVETKGIPMALMTARALNLPLLIIRRDNRVTEGSSVGIHYLSGSSKRISTMSLPRRALPEKARVLFIDDFMKAGGTARGCVDLMVEYAAEVVGIGVLVATAEPAKKLVDDYLALLVLEGVDELARQVVIGPSPWLVG
ncbi:MAG: pur operon repressor [Bacillota bacterium]